MARKNTAKNGRTIKSINPVTMDYRPKEPCDPRISQQIRRYREDSHDMDPRLALCASLEGYVVQMIHKDFGTYFQHFDDLYEEAMLAILKKADRYDPSKGTKTTFCTNEIKHAMFKWVSEEVMMSTTHYAENEIKINRVLRNQENPESFTAEQIYDMLGGTMSIVTIRRVLELKRERRDAKWYSIESGAWNDTPYNENIPAYYKPEEYVEQVMLGKQLHESLSCLTDEERDLVTSYYGLDCCPASAKVLSQKYGTTQYYVMKRVTKAVKKLRKAMTGSAELQA